MQSSAKKKIKAIITWYRMSGRHLDVDKKLQLLKLWKEICVEYEEYEIASALRTERARLIRALRFNNKGPRTYIQEFKLRLRVIWRKVKRKLFRTF